MKSKSAIVGKLAAFVFVAVTGVNSQSQLGIEVSTPRHLSDGEEYRVGLDALLAHGRQLFTAAWTSQEGGGRPLSKGTGGALSNPAQPLVFPRGFNRLSGPDANSCAGCHNAPFGLPGGGGDIVANVFVLGQRFDSVTFDGNLDAVPTTATTGENGQVATLRSIANSRATIGMFGSGFIEMLARQITVDLRATRDAIVPGGAAALTSKGISFGRISRRTDGRWDTDGVTGLPQTSLKSNGATDPPSLIVRPFHQSGSVISLRQFTNNAYNHHHGIQSAERFGRDADPDGDGFVNELTRADVTAVTVFQATLAVPGRVLPGDPEAQAAVAIGERKFVQIGCATCHIPVLPLDRRGWVFTEPNPFNPPGNLRPDEAPALTIDLSSDELPQPRLKPTNGIVWVPAFTDLRLHDITSGPDDPNAEALDQQKSGSAVFDGNRRFISKKLWGIANEPPYYHHGMYTTMREAIVAHAGEALAAKTGFDHLQPSERDGIIEFLKTLQVLPLGTKRLVVGGRSPHEDSQR